jgi:hypothetical protein
MVERFVQACAQYMQPLLATTVGDASTSRSNHCVPKCSSQTVRRQLSYPPYSGTGQKAKLSEKLGLRVPPCKPTILFTKDAQMCKLMPLTNPNTSSLMRTAAQALTRFSKVDGHLSFSPELLTAK